MLALLTPDLRVPSVLRLDRPRLGAMGLDGLLLDVDGTLKNYAAPRVGPEVRAWLDDLRGGGIRLCLVSNGRAGRLGPLADELGVELIAKACKPLPFRLRRAIARLGFDPRRTAMVGDQLFTDIMAARWAGLRTILVRPDRPEEEPWFTRVKRPLERVLLRRMDAAGPREE